MAIGTKIERLAAQQLQCEIFLAIRKVPMYYRITSICCLALLVGCSSSTTEPSKSGSSSAPSSAGSTTATAPATEATSTGPASEQATIESGGWGTLKGRFVYDGELPKTIKLNPTKDQAVCGKHELINESLIVNPENKGIQNVVVFLYTKKGDTPPVHDSYASTAEDKVILDNEHCRFNNHVTVLRTSQTLLVRNLDGVGHNTKIDTKSNPAINPILPANGDLEHRFSKAERLPVPVSCSIHPWMVGYLLVQDHPYFAVTDENGEFEIKNLPTGNWTFSVWQEKCKAVQEVQIGGADAKWKRGRFEQAIPEGDTDIGEIVLSAALFE